MTTDTIHLIVLCLFLLTANSGGYTVEKPGNRVRSDLVTPVNSESSDGDFQFHVAPMQCYTNEAMRQLFRALSSDAILWTEMEKVPDLIKAERSGLQRRFGPPGYKDFVLQLGGNDVDAIRDCIRHLTNHGYTFSEINLNCGCPSIESGGSTTYGASLMKHPLLTRDLLQAIRDSTTNEDTEVSLKCRIAVFDTPDDMTGDKLSEEQYQTLHKYIEQAHEGGISHLVLHARAAVLSGLSPTKNRQVPALDYETVQRVSRNFPRVRVTLNGGISGMPRFTKIADTSSANGVSSFMAGRWMLRRPLDLARIQSHFSEPDSPNDERDSNTSNSGSVVQAVEQYSSYLKQCVQQPSSKQSHFPTLSDLCLPLYMISEQLREDYEEEDDLSDNETSSERWLKDADIESMYDTIRDTVAWLQEERGAKKTKFSASSIQFKKLSSSFKGLVGTKVANKWKRNRVEL